MFLVPLIEPYYPLRCAPEVWIADNWERPLCFPARHHANAARHGHGDFHLDEYLSACLIWAMGAAWIQPNMFLPRFGARVSGRTGGWALRQARTGSRKQMPLHRRRETLQELPAHFRYPWRLRECPSLPGSAEAQTDTLPAIVAPAPFSIHRLDHGCSGDRVDPTPA